VLVPNELGLHMRAAKVFADAASRYESQIKVGRGDLKINGKSIMGLLMLAAPLGTELTLEVEGRDAEEAVRDLVDLVRSGFGEGVARTDGTES
jgi:phosphocarrier protein